MPKHCGACGGLIPDGETVCQYCLTPTEASADMKKNKFCRSCGKPIAEGARFCRSCGAPVVMTIAKTGNTDISAAAIAAVSVKPSDNKNTPVNHTEALKRKIDAESIIAASAPIKVSAAKTTNNTGHKSLKNKYENNGTRRVSGGAAARRLPSVKTTVALLLVLAMIIAAFSIGLNRCGSDSTGSDGFVLTNISYTDKELAAEGVKAAVTSADPIATAAGVTLDMGTFNLYGDSTVEVKQLPVKTDSNTGVTVTAYDFNLTDDTSGEAVTAFPTLVDITIPCTAGLDELALVQYLDPETGSWQIIDSTRDYENDTLTFQTTHFSIYGEAKIVLGSGFSYDDSGIVQLPSQSFAYVGGYTNPLSEVYFIGTDIDKLMASIDLDQMKSILGSCKINPEDMVSALLGLGNDTANVLDLKPTDKLINTLIMGESGLEKWGKSLKVVGSALVFAKVAYQLYIGGEAQTVAYLNAVDLSEALLTVGGLALGSEALLMAATFVFISKTIYSLATLEVTSIQEQGYINFNNSLGAVYYAESKRVEPREQASLSQAYFIPSGPIVLDSGGKGFARALDAIYEHYKDKPAEMQKALDSLIEGYVNCFWDSKRLTDDDRVRYAYLKDGYNEQNPQKWIQPSAAAVQGYKDEFRNQLMSDIKPLMKEFSERIFHDLKEQLRKTIETEYVPFLNTVMTIETQVQESGKTFDKTEFGSDFSMRFSPEQCPSWITSDQYTADYNPKAHSGSNLIYKSTVYNFLQIGNPEEIEFINQNSSNGESDDFYAKLDWSAFPVGKIKLDSATEEVGGLTYYSKSYFGNLDDLLNPLMQKQDKFAITSNDGTFSISVAAAYSDKSGAPADPENYTSYEKTITPSYFTISGEMKEGGTCSITGMLSYSYSEDDVEETSGDYYHVIEHWISENTKDVTISGTGTVSFVNNYDDKLGNIKIMVLTFTEINVTGNEKYKLLYKTEFPSDSSLNTTEVKTDTTKALDYTDSFGIEFSVE